MADNSQQVTVTVSSSSGEKYGKKLMPIRGEVGYMGENGRSLFISLPIRQTHREIQFEIPNMISPLMLRLFAVYFVSNRSLNRPIRFYVL